MARCSSEIQIQIQRSSSGQMTMSKVNKGEDVEVIELTQEKLVTEGESKGVD